MIKWVFDKFYILDHEEIFIIFIISILLMIILAGIFVRNEINHDHK